MLASIFTPISNIVTTVVLAISMLTGSIAGVTSPNSLDFGALQGAADFRSSLASSITDDASSFTLVSTSTASGVDLVQGQQYGFKIGGREYAIGTLSAGKEITSVTRGVSPITGTTTASLAEPWGRGTVVEITDAPLLLEISNKVSGTQYFDSILTYNSAFSFSTTSNQLASTLFVKGAVDTASSSVYTVLTQAANTISGLLTFSTLPVTSVECSGGTQFCNKDYIDAQVIAGGTDGTDSVKGVYELATKAEVAAGTGTGSTGAFLVIPASMATSSSDVATTSVVVTGTDGKIDNSFLNLASTVSVRAYQSSGTELTATPATLAFQAEDLDTDTMHDNSTNNERLTINTAGTYLVGASVEAGDLTIGADIVLNGSTVIASGGAPSNTGNDGLSVLTLYEFAQNDYVTVVASVNGTGNTTVASFWAYKID